VKATLGNGHCSGTLNGSADGGDLRYTLGQGTVNWAMTAASDIAGALQLNYGSCESTQTTITGSGTRVHGAFHVQSGGGTDDLIFEDQARLSGQVQVALGGESDTIRIDDTMFDEVASFDTGAGDDDVMIETLGVSPGPVTLFVKAVTIRTGAGNDTLPIGILGEAGNRASFQAAVTLDGGAGTGDVVDYQGNGDTYAVTPVVTGFETVA